MENSNITTTPEKKVSVKSKVISLTILVIVLVILAWSATQIVKIFPNAISSLASIAESVYTYRPSSTKENLNISSSKSLLDSGESIILSWDEKKINGIYTFSYECEDGVAVDLKSEDGIFKSISCNSSYDLGTSNQIEIKVDSEKKRFVDLNYTIAYFKKNETAATIRDTNSISIFNSRIVENGEGSVIVDKEEDKDTSTDSDATKKPDVVEVDKPIVTTPTPPTTVTTPIYIYEIPTSQPDGQVDLLLSSIKVGVKNNLGHFIETDRVNKGVAGGIQFVVHNIGNKTSEKWTFEVNIFNETAYTSSEQLPLKPNERAIITIEYDAPQKTGNQLIEVTAKTEVDRNQNNNYLNRQIIIN